ncbi:MAG: rRNA cytosine-C5-methyltransferase [Muribaculaceae bacterium]|nr:rRNA cytosine-C5-methyltransferase [Muribaculaceae bacterium]
MDMKQEFVEMLRHTLGNEAQELCSVIADTEPSVSVRVNTAKGAHLPAGVQRVPWCEAGFYLDQRPAFTFDPMMHAGMYYVQDASSMFIHHVIRQLVHHPVQYLDLCAAPGGKTTAALQALPEGSLVVANEIVPNRARALADNVIRWGSPHVVVTCNAPSQLGQLTHAFDVVATDVPCSGEGMMRKDDEAVAQWSPALVEQCAARQRDILRDIWPALRPGGLLIYSTCTYNRQENEQMVEHLVGQYAAQPVAISIDDAWGISPAIDCQLPCYRFMPHRTRGEGLFMAVLRKPDGPCQPVRAKKPTPGKGGGVPKGIAQWLNDGQDYDLSLQADDVVANPRAHAHALAALRSTCHVVYSGVTLATIKGKNFVPHHSLAMSTALNRDAHHHQEVDYLTALAYLRGEAITVDAPRGYVLVTYGGIPLGWVNNLGSRANNLYPKGLRILSKNNPDQAPCVVGKVR